MRKKKSAQPVASRTRRSTFLLMPMCGLVLISGFFLAGRQHFSSMDYGMKNSRLRRQIDDLEAEKRRLLHAREISLSPTEIKRVAKKAGLTDLALTPIPSVVKAAVSQEKPPAHLAVSKDKPVVVKTASVSPAGSSIPVALTYAKVEKTEKATRKPIVTE